MDKSKDLQRWLDTSNENIEHYSFILEDTVSYTPNELHKAIDKLNVSISHFNESFKWWKNSVDSHELHDAEKNYKKIVKLHSKLETMRG